ncbi:MAG: YciI family protein [Pseudomonadota bacterium]
MNTYALLLPYHTDRYKGMDPEEYMDIIKDYIAWSEDLGARGLYAGGHKLADDPGITVARNGDSVEVHDTPSAESAEILGGLILVNAESYEAAAEIAKTCPHLTYNEKIEIRQVDEAGED